MSSDKVSETVEKTKQVGGEKAEDIKKQFDSANKEAEAQLDASSKNSEPSYTDQAKEKAAQAKDGAGATQEKVTGAVADSWAKTKDTISNLNQYPDKK